ncbi:MAG: molybdate ABC transporter permease subunit [Chloroflexi bacterium]|nr:molybdate ABC transporter permease subunit [Chloroflexota bacterium]MQC47735.1 molybdate ABC transporter permease subunit [Chloroflexota bacterium]
MNLFDLDPAPFRVSLQVSVLGMLVCLVVGVPVSWWAWQSRPMVRQVISTLVLLPLVVPPISVGYFLLYGLGRQSELGRWLVDDVGLRLVFTWPGAGIAAGIVALPLFVRTLIAGLEQVDREYLDVGRTLGRSSWVLATRIVFPLAWPAFVAATLIAFARSFGEFGATIIVAGNIPGHTQTVPAAIYDAVQAGDRALANGLAYATVLVSAVFLSALAWMLQRGRTL